jgi:hypothetical protein
LHAPGAEPVAGYKHDDTHPYKLDELFFGGEPMALEEKIQQVDGTAEKLPDTSQLEGGHMLYTFF